MQYHKKSNAYVSGDKKQCTCMCLIPNHHKRMYVWSQTISKRECVRNVCERVFFCVSYVDKNRAYAYVYASLWQTRCVCMQIYIKNFANAHVLCALLRYHNKRACVWLENRERLRFFHCSSLFGFPCCAAFSSACCRSHERRAGNGGNPPGRRDEWAGCSDWSRTWLWNSICVAYGRN